MTQNIPHNRSNHTTNAPTSQEEEATLAKTAMEQAHKASKTASKHGQTLTPPSKAQGAFLTIREVADTLALQQHVLRFWETKFSQIKPLKRGGGRRYYRPEDVILLHNIKYLLYTQGYTIKGVQKLLKEEGKKVLTQGLLSDQDETSSSDDGSATILQSAVASPAPTPSREETLHALLTELKTLRDALASS